MQASPDRDDRDLAEAVVGSESPPERKQSSVGSIAAARSPARINVCDAGLPAALPPQEQTNCLLVDLEIEMLENIRAAWDSHAEECDQPPKAILLNPGNYELVGWHEVLGLPVLPDESVAPKRFKLVCGTGHGGYCAEGVVYWDEDGGAYVAAPAEEAA